MSTSKNLRKGFRPTVILSLLVLLAAVPLNNVMADTHAWVSGFSDIGPRYWEIDKSDNIAGMTSDDMSSPPYIQGYADTLGTVKLSVNANGTWWIEGYADISDTYTFTDFNNPSASGLIAGLYGKIDYSGTLTSAYFQGVGGSPNFHIQGVGTISLDWNGTNYTLSIPGQSPVDVNDPVQHVSGSFTLPINGAYYGQPFDRQWFFVAYANNPGLANLGVSSDFYNTVKFSFYADGFTLKVTSIGGYNQGSNTPAAFSKISPANGAINQSNSPTLTWEASTGATSYEYCYDTTNDNACSSWMNNGTSTSASLSGLANGTTYYWQVRAVNADGPTYSDNSSTAFWSFTTIVNPPAAFNKTSPANGDTNQSTPPTLSWDASTGADSYEYCYDTTNNNACDGSWTSAGSNLSVVLNGLSAATNYYWQVKAHNGTGTINANDGSWWEFSTVYPKFHLYLPLILK